MFFFLILLNILLNDMIRTKTNLNISFEAVEGESLIMSLEDIALSSGSACTSASLEPSYVLRAIGVDEEVAHTSLRFGLGRFTTEEEVKYLFSLFILRKCHCLLDRFVYQCCCEIR
jgi:cysteine sulfinate desulfinase/cysteine desulfurase-like protein